MPHIDTAHRNEKFEDVSFRGSVPKAFDYPLRWVRRVTLIVVVIMAGWGASVLLREPVTLWFAISTMTWIALLLICALWQLRGSGTAISELAQNRWPRLGALHLQFR